MTEYTEPTNEQLARFLTVYVPSQMGLDLHPSPLILERLLNNDSNFRKTALGHHRRFQQQVNEVTQKMREGKLPCAYIRPNGKPCPNFNEPRSFYCGLHKDKEEGPR